MEIKSKDLIWVIAQAAIFNNVEGGYSLVPYQSIPENCVFNTKIEAINAMIDRLQRMKDD